MFAYERGGPADITTPYWLTGDAVSSSARSHANGLFGCREGQCLAAVVHQAYIARISEQFLRLDFGSFRDGISSNIRLPWRDYLCQKRN